MVYSSQAGVIVPHIQKFKKQLIFAVAAIFMVSIATMTLSASAAATTTIYKATPDTLPSSLISLGFEATDTAEFGDRISFAGTKRNLSSATITMVSWACQTGQYQDGNCVTTPGTTFNQDVTLNIYNVNGEAVGERITSKTQNFAIPYRPSADNTCGNNTAWKDATGNCQNGLASNITFDLSGVNVPDQIIYGISFNTSTSGYNPLTTNGPYDALNVGLTNNTQQPTVGVDVDKNSLFWNSSLYGDGTFKLATGWSPYTIAIQFDAKVAAKKLADKDDCKNNGWALGAAPDGKTFKNQGQCVSHFTSNGTSTNATNKNR